MARAVAVVQAGRLMALDEGRVPGAGLVRAEVNR